MIALAPKNMKGYARVYYTDGTYEQHSWSYSPNVFIDSSTLEEWVKVTSTINLNSSKTPDYISHFYVYGRGFSQGEMEVSMIQVEEKSFATSFVDGSRDSGELIYSCPVSPNNFTINFWAKNNGWSGSYPWYLSISLDGGLGGSNRVYFRPTSATSISGGRLVGGSGNGMATVTINNVNEWNMYTLTSDEII
jgi:hypothetical protein